MDTKILSPLFLFLFLIAFSSGAEELPTTSPTPKIVIASETGEIIITDVKSDSVNRFEISPLANNLHLATGDFDGDGEDELAVSLNQQVQFY